MKLTDRRIKELNSGLIKPYSENRVQSICYDLTADTFHPSDREELQAVKLKPGDAIFVKSAEAIALPADMCATVHLRNSRIRQGLELTAPVYYPGHHTRVFYRVANVSKSTIELHHDDGIASIIFEDLGEPVERPYEGTFSDEVNFSGMAAYSAEYSEEISEIDEKLDSLKSLERNIYSNILAILAVFVAVFSLVNVNVAMIANSADVRTILTVNFTTVGAISFLVATIATITEKKRNKSLWCASITAFILAVIIQHIV